MKNYTFILLIFLSMSSYSEELSIRSDVIEIDSAVLNRLVLQDIPGSIFLLLPDKSGNLKPTILGQKVLKDNQKLPEIEAKPTELISHTVVKNVAAGLGYLSFVSASMDNKDEVKFSVTQTAFTSILDNQIDWPEFNKRVKAIRKANPNLPKGTKFGVVRVADIVNINYQVFTQVRNSSKISGWGFSGNSKYLSQKTDRSNKFSVGVALSYSEADMASIFSSWPLRASNTSESSKQIRKSLESVETMQSLDKIIEKGNFMKLDNLQVTE
jgi:hypothetical protein